MNSPSACKSVFINFGLLNKIRVSFHFFSLAIWDAKLKMINKKNAKLKIINNETKYQINELWIRVSFGKFQNK